MYNIHHTQTTHNQSATMTHHDEADFCLPNSGNSPIIKNMSIRTRLHIAGEPSVAYVVQEYLTSYRPPMNILVGRMFHQIYRLNPELPRTFMHEVNQDQLTEEILASVKIPRNRLQYSLLLEDFFCYAQRHGWVDKSE